jgi:glycosyltransferase involved in cell wall biosynthesis
MRIDINISGMKKIKLLNNDIIEGIIDVMENYSKYQKDSLLLKKQGFYNWDNITKDLLNIYKKII